MERMFFPSISAHGQSVSPERRVISPVLEPALLTSIVFGVLSWSSSEDGHHSWSITSLFWSQTVIFLSDEVQQAFCQSGGQRLPLDLLQEKRYHVHLESENVVLLC